MTTQKVKKTPFQGKYGDPIYNEYGQIVGFVGSTPSQPIDYTNKMNSRIKAMSKDLKAPLRVQSSAATQPTATPPVDNSSRLTSSTSSQQYAPTLYSGSNTNPSWNEFVQRASAIAKANDFPVQVLLGQAALETGRNPANAPGNNWFGIKGAGTAGSNALSTQEFGSKGYYGTKSNFAGYNSPDESIQSYINLIKTKYPQAYALKNDPSAMIQAIHRSGYATDPAYAQKVMSTPEFRSGGQVAGASAMGSPTIALASAQRPYQPKYIASTSQPIATYFNNLDDVQNRVNAITHSGASSSGGVSSTPRNATPSASPAQVPTPQAIHQDFFKQTVNTGTHMASDFGNAINQGVKQVSNFFGGLFK